MKVGIEGAPEGYTLREDDPDFAVLIQANGRVARDEDGWQIIFADGCPLSAIEDAAWEHRHRIGSLMRSLEARLANAGRREPG